MTVTTSALENAPALKMGEVLPDVSKLLTILEGETTKNKDVNYKKTNPISLDFELKNKTRGACKVKLRLPRPR